MYTIKKLITQEPAAVVAVLAQWLTLLAVTNVINWSTEVVAGVQGAGLATLLLFYVRPAVVSISGLNELKEATQRKKAT